MNMISAIDFMVSLEKEFITRVDRAAENDLNEAYIEEIVVYINQPKPEEEEEEKIDDLLITPEFYDISND